MVDYIVKQVGDLFTTFKISDIKENNKIETINTNEEDIYKDMFYTFNISDNEDDKMEIDYINNLNDTNKLKRISEGYETDIECENDVFKEDDDEILYSIKNYIKNKTNKFMKLLEKDIGEKCDIDNITNTLDDLFI